jgi:tetratricopeptide (TPR) repeat protein
MRPKPQNLALLSLSAALALSPLLFYPQCQNIFWTSESALVRTLAPLAFALACLAWPDEGVWRERRLRPLAWLGAALFAWLALSGALSLRKDLAMNVLLEWLSYPLAFAAAWRAGKDASQRGRLRAAILLAGLLMAAYGLAQSLGWDFLNWNANFDARGSSTLGNPNFFGGHMALLLPLALALALEPGATWAWLLVLVLGLGLFSSATRGAQLGAGLGLGLVLYLQRAALKPAWQARKRWILSVSLGLLALLAGLVLLASVSSLRAQALGRPSLRPLVRVADVTRANLLRGSEVFKGGGQSAFERSYLARCSMAMAGQHPLLGVGPGNFRIYFPSVQASAIPKDRIKDFPYIISEHSHNDWVQMAAEGGFMAALLLLALEAGFFSIILRRLPAEGLSRGLAVGSLAGLAALEVHGLFNFPFLILPTQMTAWALAALALREAILPEAMAAEALPAEASLALKRRRAFLRWLGFGLAAALALGMAAWACLSFIPDRLLWEGAAEVQAGNFRDAESRLNKALSLQPRNDRIMNQRALAYARQYYTLQATVEWNEVLKLDPWNAEVRVRLGRAFLELSQLKQAEEVMEPVEAQQPNFTAVYEPLGACRYQQKEYAEALKTYQQGEACGAALQVMLENQAACLGNLNRLDEAIAVLRRALENEPGSIAAINSMAITWLRKGDKAEARSYAQRCLDYKPDDPTALKILSLTR